METVMTSKFITKSQAMAPQKIRKILRVHPDYSVAFEINDNGNSKIDVLSLNHRARLYIPLTYPIAACIVE